MDKEYNKELGKKVKKLRESENLSQRELSQKLEISRSTLSQIENGNRRLSVEELMKISRSFQISIDVLLNLRNEPEININEKVDNEPEQKLRINVPQKNVEKFTEVLLYILNETVGKPNIGKTVIYKLLYFIDFNYYEKYEKQLIGATYRKNRYGPSPVEFKEIIDRMKENEDVEKIDSEYFDFEQKKYLPLRKPDLSILSADELEVIENVLERLSDMNATQISEYSHGDVPWLATDDSEIIEYESVFYRTPPYSVREYDEDERV